MKKILPHVFFISFVSIFLLFFVSQAQAVCELSSNPSAIAPNVNSEVTLSFQNTTLSPIHWIRVWSENDSILRVNTVSLEGWSWDGTTLTGNEIGDGITVDLLLNVTAGDGSQSTRIFLETNDEVGGGNLVSCGEGAFVEISSAIVVNPTISNISLAVSPTSATISWDTDLATNSFLQFGANTSYGSEVGNGTFTTAHSLTLTDLSPETLYHYRLLSFTQNTGSVITNDLSFMTGAINTVTTVSTVTHTVTQTVTTTKTVEATLIKVVTDTTPPVVKITPLEGETFSAAPLVTGTVNDNRGVSRVEYQVDKGGWSSASLTEEVGEKKSAWEFVPSLSLDGTYEIEIRGVDVFGNTSAPKTFTFVIDQLPPTVGGGVVQYRGMKLVAQQGVVTVWAEDTYEVIVHEIGGAEEIQLLIGEKNWNLTKIKGTSLWKTEVQLPQGNWKSTVTARDGARKITSRPWLSWTAVPKAHIQRNSVHTAADITLFWKEPTTGRFEPWHASEYGQESTLPTENTGFGWVVPPGEYYFSAQLPGEKIVSPIFKTKKISLLGGDWEIGNPSWWSRFFAKKISVGNPFPSSQTQINTIAAQKENLEALIDPRWIGKKKIVVVVSPSLPGSHEGLTQTQSWAKREEAELILLGEQVSAEQLQAWLGDNNSLSQTTDYEGKWLIPGNITLLPKAYLFDSYGKLVSIREGDLQ